MFEVFRLWLIVLCAAIAVAGALLVLAVGTPAFRVAGRLLDRPFWPDDPDPVVRRFQSWAYSVTFATMAGWGLALTVLVANAFGSRQAWVWWAVAGSIGLWYPLDTGRSLFHRAWANVALNTAVLIAAAIPLVGTAAEFH